MLIYGFLCRRLIDCFKFNSWDGPSAKLKECVATTICNFLSCNRMLTCICCNIILIKNDYANLLFVVDFLATVALDRVSTAFAQRFLIIKSTMRSQDIPYICREGDFTAFSQRQIVATELPWHSIAFPRCSYWRSCAPFWTPSCYDTRHSYCVNFGVLHLSWTPWCRSFSVIGARVALFLCSLFFYELVFFDRKKQTHVKFSLFASSCNRSMQNPWYLTVPLIFLFITKGLYCGQKKIHMIWKIFRFREKIICLFRY